MAATEIYSVTMVLRKETAFPLCRAVERKECCLPGVFSDSGDTPANHLCELNGQCVCGKWVEDVCVCWPIWSICLSRSALSCGLLHLI